MVELPVASLDVRQQKLVENARLALQRGNLDYALEATAEVLKGAPGCVMVRKLRRVAQLRRSRAQGGGLLAKMASGFSSAPFFFGGAGVEASKRVERAEVVLEKHPHNVPALKMLACAAEELGWAETTAFALEAIREIEPGNRANLLALGEAWLETGRPADALRIADALLREDPVDGDAQDLMRKASVAETLVKGRWENNGTFRENVRAGLQGTSIATETEIETGEPRK